MRSLRTADSVREARRRYRLTQEQLAARAGTSQEAVSRIERGAVEPGRATLARLFHAMGEEIVTDHRRIDHEADPIHLAASRSMSMEHRLEQAFNWMVLAGALHGTARRRAD